MTEEVYTTVKGFTKLNCYPSSFNTHGKFISCNVDKIAFILTLLVIFYTKYLLL